MKLFDCSMIIDIPDQEIRAKTADEAKKIFIEAVKRFIDEEDCALAIEVEEVDA